MCMFIAELLVTLFINICFLQHRGDIVDSSFALYDGISVTGGELKTSGKSLSTRRKEKRFGNTKVLLF